MTQICADPTFSLGQDPKANASALGGRFPLNVRSLTLLKDTTMATRLIDFFFRLFFGSPDQEYRGVPSAKDDQLLDKTMAGIAVVAVFTFFALELIK